MFGGAGDGYEIGCIGIRPGAMELSKNIRLYAEIEGFFLKY
jgi:hypothetical protein